MTPVFRVRHRSGWQKKVDELTEADWRGICRAARLFPEHPGEDETLLCAEDGVLFILAPGDEYPSFPAYRVDPSLYYAIPG